MTPERLAEIERVHHMLPVEELTTALRGAWAERDAAKLDAEKVVEAARMRAGYLHNDTCGHVLEPEGKYECSCGHTQLRKALAEYDARAKGEVA